MRFIAPSNHYGRCMYVRFGGTGRVPDSGTYVPLARIVPQRQARRISHRSKTDLLSISVSVTHRIHQPSRAGPRNQRQAVEIRVGEAAAVRAGELPTRPTIDAVAAGPVAAMQRLGRLQLEL